MEVAILFFPSCIDVIRRTEKSGKILVCSSQSSLVGLNGWLPGDKPGRVDDGAILTVRSFIFRRRPDLHRSYLL